MSNGALSLTADPIGKVGALEKVVWIGAIIVNDLGEVGVDGPFEWSRECHPLVDREIAQVIGARCQFNLTV